MSFDSSALEVFYARRPTSDQLWLVLATIFVIVQCPLVGVRWAWINDALGPKLPRMTVGSMIAITLIANFFSQIVPNIISDALRIWLLSKIGSG